MCVAKSMCSKDELWKPENFPDQRPNSIERNTREGAEYRERFAAEEGVEKIGGGVLFKMLNNGPGM